MNMDRGLHGGGINGGVIVFTPDKEEYHKMMIALEKMKPPENSGGEQSFISQYMGMQKQIRKKDVALDLQVHQLSWTAAHDHEEGR